MAYEVTSTPPGEKRRVPTIEIRKMFFTREVMNASKIEIELVDGILWSEGNEFRSLKKYEKWVDETLNCLRKRESSKGGPFSIGVYIFNERLPFAGRSSKRSFRLETREVETNKIIIEGPFDSLI